MDAGTEFEGKYVIEREIGRGSFGVVFLAKDLQSGKRRAIKLLLPWAQSDRSLRHRLSREARLASQLTSPNAIRIVEHGETRKGCVYVVMEYIEGKELTELIREHGVLQPDRLTPIAEQILDALADAHDLGVIHRDLKPGNVLITNKDGREVVTVCDFGIAKVAGVGRILETAELTIPGSVLGTPEYMSPEQCRGERLTPASDLYSLGIVLYEALTGKPPFVDANPVMVMVMQNEDPVAKLPDQIAQTPLGSCVLRALEKVPEARFASATEFLAAINSGGVRIQEPSVTEKTDNKPPPRKRGFFRR